MRLPPIVSIFGLALAIAFLAAFSSPQKTYPVVTETKNGVKTITNPDYPREGRFTARLTVEMSCGQAGATEAGTFNKPIDLRVDDQAFVYVMDWGDGHIKVYDGGGKFVREISQKGQGPGEFEIPALFDLMSGGRVCILDQAQRRIMFLTTEGQYLSMFSLNGFFRSVQVDSKDELYLGKWEAVGEPRLSEEFREVPYLTSILRTDISGKALVHLADFQGEMMYMKAVGQGVVGGGGLYTILWGLSPSGRIYGGYNEDYRLRACGSDGMLEFSFGRVFKPVKNTRLKGPFAKKKNLPVFGKSNHAIIFDEDENLWIELFQDNEKKGFIYDVFSTAGIYLMQVKIEYRIFQFKKGKAYSLVQPEAGYPSVKRFQIDLVPEDR